MSQGLFQNSLPPSQFVKIVVPAEPFRKFSRAPTVMHDTEVASTDHFTSSFDHPLTTVDDVFHWREIIVPR